MTQRHGGTGVRATARGVVAATAVALLATACGNDDAIDPRVETERTLTVYAAASLEPTFTRLADQFESERDGVTVRLSFAGSSDLAAQLLEGAPADVFASADRPTMRRLVDEELVGDPQNFATNTLVIVTPPKDPGAVTSLFDLADPGRTVVTCAPEVPCGAATEEIAAAARLTISTDSEERSVTDVLGKVIAGEADAGLVYVTDAEAAGDDVRTVELPDPRAAVNRYPAAVLTASEQPGLAEEWIDLLLSEKGRTVLGDAGFGAP